MHRQLHNNCFFIFYKQFRIIFGLLLCCLSVVASAASAAKLDTKSESTKSAPSDAHNLNLFLEVGETYPVPPKTQRIWIEKKAVLKAYVKNKHPYLKATAIGQSYIRIDDQLKSLYVLPPSALLAMRRWIQWQSRFVDIRVATCDQQICLKGRLYRLRDYERILEIFAETGLWLPLALQISPTIENELRLQLARKLRSDGHNVSKVIFSEPWKIRIHGKQKSDSELQKKYSKFGLTVEYSNQALAVENNVKISVQIVEMNRNFERNTGLRWPDTISAQLQSTGSLQTDALELSLNMAEKSGDARVLASPNLLCRNGEEAHFFAGGEFPIKTLGYRSEKIIWKQYGIDLRFKPLIDNSGQMSLSIETEVSYLDRSLSADGLPAVQSHKVSSRFDLIEEKTIILSGLIKSEQSQNTEGIAYLKNLPVLGSLFSSKKFQNNRSELIIFVTPKWMRPYE